ncbi:polysaccharide deacetylase family protein [Bradyrhizobium sp. JYMT SZCCT0428]|uniref:polysaccharide deacetylase family protein n=1 Tax=Bradyrhizobium sp. JYMT SZCCT0428 TaxID=2807673 RepID=UPI001BA76C29|nr:polysaccharide deacetylase family protein [Bradyrhizobium sp. JYMT SZCCT0428]MBR1155812.1 polysaccharide deacetylase family protein [Bradyrhizobium sp. JYMT SZCCT0428]
MKQQLKDLVCHGVSWAGLMPAVRSLFAGRAAIISFHEIQREFRCELATGTSVSLFEHSLRWLRREGWEIVSLEECLDRVSRDDRSRRYAVLTFDDAYRDNVSVALPILERHNAPFMMYVPTGAPTRTLESWWLGLRELIRSRDDVTVDAMETRFHCPDVQAKVSALARATQWVHEDYHRAAMLAPTFRKAGISLSALNDAYFLDEREIQALSHHPLASIGGHTTSHPALKNLDSASARAEMADNRNYLQNLTQRPVRHFAYPYGNPKASGPREEQLCSAVGFLTGVTTRPGPLDNLPLNYFALPRVFVDSEVGFQARMSGLQRAFRMLIGDARAA